MSKTDTGAVLGAEATDTTLEAQRVAAFAKFQPICFFDTIKELQISGTKWRVLATADIEDTEDGDFLGVIAKWTSEAEILIPPVQRTEIIEEQLKDTLDKASTGEEAVEIVRTRRVLHPKRADKDQPLTEDVVVMRVRNDVVARFIPCVESAADIPFYYPKVNEFAFGYLEPTSGDGDVGHAPWQLAILVQELEIGATVATKKHKGIWKDMIKKLYKWTATARLGYQKRQVHDVLVDHDAYVAKYQELKSKYADYWVKNWPEQTDPRKFVFEDIAIASWIICLWTQESGNASPTFVDLGCGNGLLVSLLAAEGYKGHGIDQCSRKVWSAFGPTTDLRVSTLEPFDYTTDADWIIGNHADELVPWIPLIAAKSAKTKFAVIPCCPHDLSGKKMNFATVAGQSKYHAYVEHISGIMGTCGFVAEKEFLRIPSTKNVALVGRTRTGKANMNEIDRMIQSGKDAFVARVPDSVKNQIRMEKSRKRKHDTSE
ncbi:tRNA(Ser) Um(44) 2'-O-methyltransferase [Linderina macrospora]|uniref:tRNA(Ser) Um(44) 2'-O-methyltransferase n=1 Tax=Linderina macrospora TaxID=4868 RepID=A0ACC1J9X5_9FUNG|nr:tRNA(Ser) Um(44) 2'-O-methyltransferase [Linderina macrospora]